VKELDSVRPDLLVYKCIGRCLIQWEKDVLPTNQWVTSQIPHVVTKVLLSAQEEMNQNLARLNDPSHNTSKPAIPLKYYGPYGKSRKLQYELSASTAFILQMNIITGYCMGIGLVYAGTFNLDAKDTILSKLKWLQRLVFLSSVFD
jgi:hypothetical protein